MLDGALLIPSYDAFLRSVLGQVVTLREQTRHPGQCAVKKQGWLKQLAEKELGGWSKLAMAGRG